MTVWSALGEWLAPSPGLTGALRHALEKAVAVVDPRLVNCRGLDRKLAGPLAYALDYCSGLVDALPGPLGIERRAFASDPLVHALFATGQSIDEMLGKSQAIRDFLDHPEHRQTPVFYALLAARRREKRQLGTALHGETIQQEVPQTVLYFADHTLTEPAPTLDATQDRLRTSTFLGLLKTFRSHLDELRVEREGVRSHLTAERGRLSQLRTAGKGEEAVIETRRIDALDRRLRELGEALDLGAVVDSLADYLTAPQQSLALTPCTVTVDRLGVVVDDAGGTDDPSLSRLEFPELVARDRRRHLVTLARIDRDEAQRAVAAAADASRRFILI